ncbi:MAG TPA: M56 family metallopeptidase [Planctomycetaceae bacterium]|jgi:beta-lactamase regulating signal transducer with metallopeptidase domain
MPLDFIDLAWRQAWQVTLLAVAIALLVALCGRNRPHLAHALFLAVLLKCLTPPLWSSSLGLFCRLQPAVSPADTIPGVDSGLEITVTSNQDTRIDLDDVSELLPDGFPFPSESGTPQSDVLSGAAARMPPRERLTAFWKFFVPIATWVWLFGCLVRLTYALIRSIGCWKAITAAARPASPELLETLDRLTQRLRIRRRVRLLVSATRVGPAVVGLCRPTIVLPEVIVAGRPASELEPILAHELIHVRRGDLWVGCLQTLTSGLWWFHPLVRGVCRALAHEAERCVDEELIAELRCDPARYARALLTVLELKRTLRPVPGFPGMKPVEITSKRLERIMSLRQGCRNRTPWWCWAVLAVALAATLPGRALIAVGEPDAASDRTTKSAPLVQAVRRTVSPAPQPAPATGAAPQPVAGNKDAKEFQTRVYAVADMAYSFHGWVTVPLFGREPAGAETSSPEKPVIDLDPVRKLIETTVAPQTWKSAGGTAQIELYSETLSLIIRQTPEVHQQIATLLRDLRREQDLQVALEIRLVQFADHGWTNRLAWPETAEKLVEGITLSRSRAEGFMKLDEVAKTVGATQFPKVTVFNEQIVEYTLPRKDDKKARPLAIAMGVVVDNDRRGVRLNLSCNAPTREAALVGARSFRLPDEEGLLIDIGPAAAAAQTIQEVPVLTTTPHLSRWFINAQKKSNAAKSVPPLMLLVLPHIIVMEEEEIEEAAKPAPH